MKSLLFAFALTLIAIPSSYSQSQREIRASVKEFLSMTRSAVDNCRGLVEKFMGIAVSNPFPFIARIEECIKNEKDRTYPRFEAIRDSLAEKNEQQAALKEYYAYWLSSMDAMDPHSRYGSKEEFRRHLGERIQKLKEMANRIIANL